MRPDPWTEGLSRSAVPRKPRWGCHAERAGWGRPVVAGQGPRAGRGWAELLPLV